jgi:hypothetical protein
MLFGTGGGPPSPPSSADDCVGLACGSAALPPPSVGRLGSGSDYTPFLQHLGIPSMAFSCHLRRTSIRTGTLD